jgi:hypothetical protein
MGLPPGDAFAGAVGVRRLASSRDSLGEVWNLMTKKSGPSRVEKDRRRNLWLEIDRRIFRQDRFQDFSGCLLNVGQRFGESGLVARVKLDVVAAGRICVETDRAGDDEGYGLRFGLPHRVRGRSPALGLVLASTKFVRGSVYCCGSPWTVANSGSGSPSVWLTSNTCAEAEESRLLVFRQLVIGFLFAYHRRKDRDAFLALAHKAPEF